MDSVQRTRRSGELGAAGGSAGALRAHAGGDGERARDDIHDAGRVRAEPPLPVRRARASDAPDVRRAARAALHCQRAPRRRHPLQSVRHLAVSPSSHEFTSIHTSSPVYVGRARSIFTAPKHEPHIRYIGRGFQMTIILAFVLD